MKGNWGFLIAAFSGGLSLVAVATGAHLYRAEAVAWLAVVVSLSVCGWCYSLWYDREKRERADAWNKYCEADHRAMVAEWKLKLKGTPDA
jgi:hypothetical protein